MSVAGDKGAKPTESTMATQRSLTAKYVEIGLVVAAYWVISISMVFLNKHLLSGDSINLNAPLFITLYQCVVALIIIVVVTKFSKMSPKYKNTLPNADFKLNVLIAVLPLSLMFVGMITFNNLCLKYVGVAFYFVGRSLTTVFNVILTYFMLGQKTSLSAIICCLIIILGFFLGVDQENETGLSLIGVICGVIASLFVCLNSIYTKKALAHVDNSVWLLTYYNNINACIILFALVLVTGEVSTVANYARLTEISFIKLMTLSGLFGFAIGYVTGLQIKVTSPLTHNISGTAKACAQTLLAVVHYGEIKSSLWWFSNGLVIFGSAAYTRVKQLEMQRMHEQGEKWKKTEKEEVPLVKVTAN